VGAGDPDKLSYILLEVFDLNPKVLVPGHRPVGEPDGLQLMRQYISTLDGLAHKMVDNGKAEEKIEKLLSRNHLLIGFFCVLSSQHAFPVSTLVGTADRCFGLSWVPCRLKAAA
jgi:hypothetical protein